MAEAGEPNDAATAPSAREQPPPAPSLEGEVARVPEEGEDTETARDSRPETPQYQMSPAHHARSPASSPTLPSPLSLHRLGIGSSPLRRRFSSRLDMRSPPNLVIRNSAGDADDELSGSEGRGSDGSAGRSAERTQDSKDVLLDRLNDLVTRLSEGGSVQEASLDTLHVRVGEMEKVLAGDRRARRSRISERKSVPHLGRPFSSGGSTGGWSRMDSEVARAPDWLVSRISALARTNSTPVPEPVGEVLEKTASMRGSQAASDVEKRLTAESSGLSDDLASVLKNLKARKEESDHLAEMLIERAEGAAKRILDLEDYAAKLEEELDANESELGYLRLRVRAAELLCIEYVPPDADPELQESIENWKSDWAELRKKMAAKKRDRRRPPARPDEENSTTASSGGASTLLESLRDD